MTPLELLRLGLNKLIDPFPEQFVLHRAPKLIEELGIPDQRAGLDERCLRREIAPCHLHAVGDRTIAVADIEPHVHEKQGELDHELRAELILLGGVQHDDIEVGKGIQVTTPIASHRQQSPPEGADALRTGLRARKW
jgi:hypothetical protein